MIFAPHTFFASIGPFGVQNDHYLRDIATFNRRSACAWRSPIACASWRTPILFCVTLQFALHAINHLADIGAAHPHWIGPFDFASLALGDGRSGLRVASRQRVTPTRKEVQR